MSGLLSLVVSEVSRILWNYIEYTGIQVARIEFLPTYVRKGRSDFKPPNCELSWRPT